MKQIIRMILAITLGLVTLLVGQLAIENVAWWWAGDTATFDAPLLNALKVGAAGAAGLATTAMIALPPMRRRRRL